MGLGRKYRPLLFLLSKRLISKGEKAYDFVYPFFKRCILKSKTKNLKLVKEIAGHKKIQTTERYARILGADVTDALNTIDGDVVEEKQVIPFKK